MSRVNALVAAKANVNAQDSDGNTALMLASGNGHTEVVRALLAAKADVNAKSPDDSSTALYMAATNGHTAAVQALLGAEADVDAKTTGTGATALIQAAGFGRTAVVQALLAAEAEVNAKKKFNIQGFTALMYAAFLGHVEVVQLLLDAKADVSAKDQTGRTALLLAKQNGHEEAARLLENPGPTDKRIEADRRGNPVVETVNAAAPADAWLIGEFILRPRQSDHESPPSGCDPL